MPSSNLSSVLSYAIAGTSSVGGSSGGGYPASSPSSLQGGSVGSSIHAPSLLGSGQTVATGTTGIGQGSASTASPGPSIPGSASAGSTSAGSSSTGSGSVPGSTSVGSASAASNSTTSAATGSYATDSAATGSPPAGPTIPASIPVISPSGSGINEDYWLATGIIASGNPTDLVIGGQTLVPGGRPYSDASDVISLETGGLVDVDGTTVQLGFPPAQATPTSQSASLSAPATASTGSQVSPGSSVETATVATVTPTSGSGSNPLSSTSLINVSLVTSTLTSAPPSFSTDSTSNTAWTGNTWLTTTQNGQTTIVPVIVGCPTCGGIHGGIILWNLPELPSVSFQFPGFPNLPHFHLPCIKVFGITVSGDCNAPPEDDNPSDEDPDTTGSNPSETAQSDSPSATSSPNSVSASTTGSKLSSSSISSGSCAPSATRTASDCSVQCSASASTQVCKTACFSTVIGCGATGTTIYSSASVSESGCYTLLPSGPSDSGIAKRAAVTGGSANNGCNFACPATLPQIPTTGPLSISLPSTDPADYEKRALAGRTFHVLEKRKAAVTITKINGCNLATPAGQPVTTPSYPGGYEFWASETNNVLPQKYQAISRYYRSTPSGCIPTITAVPANQIQPIQNSGDNNDQVSVDHACKFL